VQLAVDQRHTDLIDEAAHRPGHVPARGFAERREQILGLGHAVGVRAHVRPYAGAEGFGAEVALEHASTPRLLVRQTIERVGECRACSRSAVESCAPPGLSPSMTEINALQLRDLGVITRVFTAATTFVAMNVANDSFSQTSSTTAWSRGPPVQWCASSCCDDVA